MNHRAIVLLLVFLTGCTATRYNIEMLNNIPENAPTERIFPYDFESVWSCALEKISTYPLAVVEKQSGIISTDRYDETATKNVHISRGVGYGGRVSDVMPIEVREVMNILILKIDSASTRVKIIKISKIRPYQMVVGPKGMWTPDRNAEFVSGESDSKVEFRLLDSMAECLSKRI